MKFIDKYEDLRKIKKYTLRERVRNSVLQPLSYINNKLSDMDALFKTPRIQFLYIHHIFSDEETALENLILQLSLHHHFISHSEAVNKILKGEIDKPYIAISSDDGLKNNVNAAAILDRFNIKGCFFVCPDITNEKDEKKITLFSKQKLHFPPVEFMNWDDIDKLMKNGHEIGGHSMSHSNLANLGEAELKSEIGQCYDKILEKCGVSKHFAFPYGRFFHFNNQARKVVFESGFESCASAERGCHISSSNHRTIKKDDLLIRRDHVVLHWPLEQILFFLLRNIRTSNFEQNFFPENANTSFNK